MAAFCYKLPNGNIIERHFPCGSAPKSVLVDGVRARRDIVAEHGSFKHQADLWRKGLWSAAVGVNPEDAAKAEAYAKKIGVPTQFDGKTGDAVFRDKKHRKQYCERIGFVDRDGGYGDPTQNRSSEIEHVTVSPEDYDY